jgi:hypothetical protein
MSSILLTGVGGGAGSAALAAGRYWIKSDDAGTPDPTSANWTVTTTLTDDVGEGDHTTYIETASEQYLKLLIWTDTLESYAFIDASIFGDGLDMTTYGWDGASWAVMDSYTEVISGAQAWTDINNRSMDSPGDALGILVVLKETSLAGPPYSPRIGYYNPFA